MKKTKGAKRKERENKTNGGSTSTRTTVQRQTARGISRTRQGAVLNRLLAKNKETRTAATSSDKRSVNIDQSKKRRVAKLTRGESEDSDDLGGDVSEIEVNYNEKDGEIIEEEGMKVRDSRVFDETRVVDSVPISVHNLMRSRDTKSGDEIRDRHVNLMRIYQSSQTYPYLVGTSETLTKLVRKSIVRHVKFWHDGDKKFGSDEYPDFTDDNFWGNVLFEQVAGDDYETDGQKARAWVTYKEDIKRALSYHRSAITNKVKCGFVKGEIYLYI